MSLPIRYVIYEEYYVLNEDQLAWKFLFYRKGHCHYNYHTWISIIYICFLQIICAYKVLQYLMYFLYDYVCLYVPGGVSLSLNTILFFYKGILNVLLRNSPSWLYMISTVHGYQTSHIVSNTFVIIIAFLSLYRVTSKKPSYRVYHFDGFSDQSLFPFYTYFIQACEMYTQFIQQCFC